MCQDSGRLNQDLEGTPRPRVSMKVGYFLSDATSDGTGFQVIPGACPWCSVCATADGASRSLASWNGAGSHKHNLLNPDGSSTLADPSLDPEAPTPEDAVSVQVQKGDAIFFDRRVRDF